MIAIWTPPNRWIECPRNGQSLIWKAWCCMWRAHTSKMAVVVKPLKWSIWYKCWFSSLKGNVMMRPGCKHDVYWTDMFVVKGSISPLECLYHKGEYPPYKYVLKIFCRILNSACVQNKKKKIGESWLQSWVTHIKIYLACTLGTTTQFIALNYMLIAMLNSTFGIGCWPQPKW